MFRGSERRGRLMTSEVHQFELESKYGISLIFFFVFSFHFFASETHRGGGDLLKS